MKRFLFALAALFMLSSPASAQICNDPSGFLKSFGPIPLGNSLVLGPDCQHAQDGGAGIGSAGAYTFFMNPTNVGALPSFYSRDVASQIMDKVTPVWCNNAAGDGAKIQAAANTGITVWMHGPCNFDQTVTLISPGQVITGDNRITTDLRQSAVLGGATFICNTGEPGPTFQNFQISYTQPDSTNRAAYTAYGPAFSCQNTPRTQFKNIRIVRGMIGIDMRGNSGGTVIDGFEDGTFTASVLIDGALDTVRINNWQAFPLSMTANQQSVFFQGQSDCTIGGGGNLGVVVGRMDDLKITSWLTIKGGWGACFFHGTGGPGGVSWAAGNTFTTISQPDFDTYAGIYLNQPASGGQSGIVQVSNPIFTLAQNSTNQNAVKVIDGRLLINNGSFQQGNPGAVPVIDCSNSLAEITITNSIFIFGGADTAAINCNGVGGGTMTFANNTIDAGTAGTLTRPKIECGSNFVCNITGNKPRAALTSATLVQIDVDVAGHVIKNNSLQGGWSNAFPNGNLGLYDEHADVAFTSTPTCGAGAGFALTASGSYHLWGKWADITVGVTTTTFGACLGNINVPLPFTIVAAKTFILAGRASAGGKMVQGIAGGANVTLVNYDNTLPIAANGDTVIFSGRVELQ